MSREKVHTFCRLCEPACGLVAEVEEQRIVALRADTDNPATKGYCCNKGLRYLDVHQDPDRLSHPLKRITSRAEPTAAFQRVSWDEAAEEVGNKLQDIVNRHGDEAIAMYNGTTWGFNSTLSTNGPRLIGPFGNGPRFGPITTDCGNKLAASEAIFGSAMVHPIPDLLHTDYFLCIGTNPAVSHMTMIGVSDPMAKLRGIKRRGGKTVFVNPRVIESSTPETGEVLLIRPDTDFYFLAALLNEIIFHVGYDRGLVQKYAKNFDRLIDFVSNWSVERAAEVTDLSADTIREVAREFCGARAASIQVATGVNMGTQGFFAYWMVQMISLLTGTLGKRGGNIYALGVCPPVDIFPGQKKAVADPYFQTEFGELRKVAGDLPCNLMSDFLQSREKPVKALIVRGGNPLVCMPDEDRFRAALNNLELIVTIDIFPTSMCEVSDYVLPARDFLEREDINSIDNGFQVEPYVQYTPAVVPAAGERRDDWWILARLAQAMGRPSMLDDPEPNPTAGIEAMLAYRGLSIDALKRIPHHVVQFPEPDPEDLFRFCITHEDGLIDCCPPLFERGYARAEELWRRLKSEPEDQLKLITLRTGMLMNSWMNNIAAHKKGIHMTNPLWMNPQDASARGLFAGSEVQVRSEHGLIQADLLLDAGLKRGVVAMTHGWGQGKSHGLNVARRFPGVNVNRLAPFGKGSFDPMSMQSHLTGINVTVEAL